jgi:hypothetical protein
VRRLLHELEAFGLTHEGVPRSSIETTLRLTAARNKRNGGAKCHKKRFKAPSGIGYRAAYDKQTKAQILAL